jgi:hypothetical protein
MDDGSMANNTLFNWMDRQTVVVISKQQKGEMNGYVKPGDSKIPIPLFFVISFKQFKEQNKCWCQFEEEGREIFNVPFPQKSRTIAQI